MPDIHIETLLQREQFEQAVELQKVYWGHEAPNLVPAHMLHSLAHYGGHIIGDYDGARLVGVVMGFIGTDSDMDEPYARPAMANLLIMSKRMLVLPAYRGRNIGFRLKMAQRDIALKQAIRLVTWTVDPLLAANAHLNVRKLGGVIQRFAADHISLGGQDSLRGDRLFVDWWVTQRRVKQRAKGQGSQLTLKQYLEVSAPIVNRARRKGGWLCPGRLTGLPGSAFARVEIPGDIRAIERGQPDLADDWRYHIREVFSQIFRAGYIVTDFVSGDYDGGRRSFYLLSRHFDDDYRKN